MTATADDLIEALRAAGAELVLDTDAVACVEGEDSDAAFVVVSGSLQATVAGHAGAMDVATHGAGSLVGEVTALIGGHRTATLRAGEPTVVSVIDRATLLAVFDEHPTAAALKLQSARERTDRSRVAALLSHELQAPDGDAVAAIADRVSWEQIGAGATLFEKGDDADAAYLVVSGRLGIVSESGATAIEVGRGGIVGEFGLLEDRGRSATVVALRDSSLARLSADDFREIAVDHTALTMGLVRRILDRSGRDHATIGAARSFAVAFVAPIPSVDRDELSDEMFAAVVACGSSVLLDPARIDTLLNQPGIANTQQGSFGEVRLAELLHQTETDADHVMLRTDAETGDASWTSRALRAADQVVVVCSARPSAVESAQLDDLLADVPNGIPTWLAVLHESGTVAPGRAAALIERFGVDEVHHVRNGHQGDVRRVARLAAGRGVGLVLSGGGARGNAHIGVFRALGEMGVPIDRVIGASMGSIIAGMIAQGLTPDEVLGCMTDGASSLLDYTVPVVSLIKGERIVGVLDGQFAQLDITDLPIPFSCVSTDLTTADVVVHRSGRLATMIRTSVSIPGVLPPVVHGDHLLADGGILDNLPVGMLADDPSIGAIVASDVAPPRGPTAKGDYGLSMSGWTALRDSSAPKRLRSRDSVKLPGIGGTLMRAMLIGSSRSRDEHLASGVIDLYLDLDLRGIALLDLAQVEPAADRGYESSQPAIAEWVAASRCW